MKLYFLFFTCLIVTCVSAKPNLTELKQEKLLLQKQLNKLSQDLAAKGLTQQKLVKQIAIADKKSKLLANNVKQLQLQQQQSQQNLHILQNNINTYNLSLQKLNQQIVQEINNLIYSELENNSIWTDSNDSEKVAIYQYHRKLIIAKIYDQYQQLQKKAQILENKNNDLQNNINQVITEAKNKKEQNITILQNKKENYHNLESVKQSIKNIEKDISIRNQKQSIIEQKIHIILSPQQQKKLSARAKNIYREQTNHITFTPPVTAGIITHFGSKLKNGSYSHGILYNTSLNTSIKAVASGVVLYSGQLAGLGEVVVIAHKNHYLSIYSGILSNVSKNQELIGGQRIGSSGDKSEQPMGGLYFELRHLGAPVNFESLY